MCVCVCQGYMDLNLTEFQKLKPNVTGFQLVNWSNPTMEKINQDWLDFDNKDLKLARRRLRVRAPGCPGTPQYTWSNSQQPNGNFILVLSFSVHGSSDL